jgi:hypothetical protein
MSLYENMSQSQKVMVLSYFSSEWVAKARRKFCLLGCLFYLERENASLMGVLEDNQSQEKALPSLKG